MHRGISGTPFIFDVMIDAISRNIQGPSRSGQLGPNFKVFLRRPRLLFGNLCCLTGDSRNWWSFLGGALLLVGFAGCQCKIQREGEILQKVFVQIFLFKVFVLMLILRPDIYFPLAEGVRAYRSLRFPMQWFWSTIKPNGLEEDHFCGETECFVCRPWICSGPCEDQVYCVWRFWFPVTNNPMMKNGFTRTGQKPYAKCI